MRVDRRRTARWVVTALTVILLVPTVLVGVLGAFASTETQEWNLAWSRRIVSFAWAAGVIWCVAAAATVWLWARRPDEH